MFKRKIYDRLVEWKQESNGKTALLIEGARRVGKSTVAEEFAKKEYKSYILIDFSVASKAVRENCLKMFLIWIIFSCSCSYNTELICMKGSH